MFVGVEVAVYGHDFLKAFLLKGGFEFVVDQGHALQVRFVYETDGPWKAVGVCQGMDRRALAEMNAELKAMSARFPRREAWE